MSEDLTTCTLTIEPEGDDPLATSDELLSLVDPATWEQVAACLIAGDE
jgi:hypothetical protein